MYLYYIVFSILYLYFNFVLYVYMQFYYDELDQCLYIAFVLRPLKLVPSPLHCMHICIFGFKGASTSQGIGARNEMMMDDYDGQMIFGDLVGLKLSDIRLTGEEKPRKTSPRKLVPTGDRTRARCVTSAHASICSTAVDPFIVN